MCISFPSSAWERTVAKLRFPFQAAIREAELREQAFPSGAWEPEGDDN